MHWVRRSLSWMVMVKIYMFCNLFPHLPHFPHSLYHYYAPPPILDIGVCPVLSAAGLDRYLWREPTITTGGKPTHNGYQCNEEGSPPPRRPRPRPDFVISAFPPKTLKTSFISYPVEYLYFGGSKAGGRRQKAEGFFQFRT